MKIVKNKAFCADCGKEEIPLIIDGMLVCQNCGSSYLFKAGFIADEMKMFIPEFGESETYQASKYCPKLPNRRADGKKWPIIKERRNRSAWSA